MSHVPDHGSEVDERDLRQDRTHFKDESMTTRIRSLSLAALAVSVLGPMSGPSFAQQAEARWRGAGPQTVMLKTRLETKEQVGGKPVALVDVLFVLQRLDRPTPKGVK